MGDFNEVRHADEQLNSRYDPNSSSAFNCFISRVGFLEYQMVGGKYTYIPDNLDVKFSKLDRIFVCERFLDKWPLANLKVLNKGWSDHCPVVLNCAALDFGPTPFKMFNSWVGSKEVTEIVNRNTGAWVLNSKGDLAFAKLLKGIKGDLKKWREFKCFQENLELVTFSNNAQLLEKKAESSGLNAEEKKARVSIRLKLKDLEIAKAKDLLQKARIKWLINGDENSSFFHIVVNKNKASNRIHGLTINEVWIAEPKTIKEELRKFFRKQFSEPMRRRPSFVNWDLPTITTEEAEMLVSPFTTDEIRLAIEGCGGNKAPGPDVVGSHGGFPLVGGDYCWLQCFVYSIGP
ncbi:uncharacterized protein LOC110942584 [Helianthus annuus]|uniref:uncharacterized protein LOC110942584 n=1 Tax=Helianthus annuus TaxID=4232 RepID=UPI000B8F363E|nr:uncharacterized protein LOC110942584 [Helianthus annuus]